jgi:hypothetical protein
MANGGRSFLAMTTNGAPYGCLGKDGGIRLASFAHDDPGYFDLEQKTLQSLDSPFGTRLSPTSWYVLLPTSSVWTKTIWRRAWEPFNIETAWFFLRFRNLPTKLPHASRQERKQKARARERPMSACPPITAEMLTFFIFTQCFDLPP